MSDWFTIAWRSGSVVMLDQRRLPIDEDYITYTDVDGVARGIKDMVIRGAPAIGVAAAYGVALAAHTARPGDDLDLVIGRSVDLLSHTRPTAVNLFWALDRMKLCFAACRHEPLDSVRDVLLQEAKLIHREDEAICAAIGEHGAAYSQTMQQFLRTAMPARSRLRIMEQH